MHLFNTSEGVILSVNNKFYSIADSWDTLARKENLSDYLMEASQKAPVRASLPENMIAPIESQEIWAAGVTYYRSRTARMEESKVSGGATFYDKVYDADRPELFYKGSKRNCSPHNGLVNIRRDSTWSVPEPELTLFISPGGKIQGYTIGNDMSARDIEGENPLYLPQAKLYARSVSLGPSIWITDKPIPSATGITMRIFRDKKEVFHGKSGVAEIKRRFEDLIKYLFEEYDFPEGVFLLTGTGVVPPDEFTLQPDDVVNIEIDGIGKLVNTVSYK
ncbi:MAG: fumarylacetoacetate hydrolase family protein [Cyclobacteriaceae bacterium]|nr:fumarylacetoacetate hydrolase family protein [Cyclobacteriaceae bacterium]